MKDIRVCVLAASTHFFIRLGFMFCNVFAVNHFVTVVIGTRLKAKKPISLWPLEDVTFITSHDMKYRYVGQNDPHTDDLPMHKWEFWPRLSD